jgi:hypothetical protein
MHSYWYTRSYTHVWPVLSSVAATGFTCQYYCSKTGGYNNCSDPMLYQVY